MKENVIALVGDIKNSRKVPDRINFDHSLLRVLNQRSDINKNVESRYTLIGDEIQAVYSKANGIFLDGIIILETTSPNIMRFSFGISNLIKEINPDQAIEMDGPAFYLARDGVNELKEKDRIFRVLSNDNQKDELINSILDVISSDILKWKKHKMEIFSRYFQGHKPLEIIDHLGLPKSTVYDILNEGNFDEYIRIFINIEYLINEGMK